MSNAENMSQPSTTPPACRSTPTPRWRRMTTATQQETKWSAPSLSASIFGKVKKFVGCVVVMLLFVSAGINAEVCRAFLSDFLAAVVFVCENVFTKKKKMRELISPSLENYAAAAAALALTKSAASSFDHCFVRVLHRCRTPYRCLEPTVHRSLPPPQNPFAFLVYVAAQRKEIRCAIKNYVFQKNSIGATI